MGTRFKSIISKYFKKDVSKNVVSENEAYTDKDTLVKQYLDKYKFAYFIGNETHSQLLNYFICYHSLDYKTIFTDDTFKIYPAKINNNELEKNIFL